MPRPLGETRIVNTPFVPGALQSAIVRRILLITFALALALPARAETIKLKNGRTIVADRVREAGDRVEYEIGDDTYAIPRSMVASISAGGAVVRGAAPPADLPDAPTPAAGERETDGDVYDLTNKVVREGAVDQSVIDAIQQQGDARMTASAYYSAGRFEYVRGNAIKAVGYLEEAARFQPQNSLIVEFFAMLLLTTGRAADALPVAQQAVRLDPRSADAHSILGFALYQADRARDAIPEWKKSLELRPNDKIQSMLARAEREVAAEEGYGEQASSHFTMRYEGSRAPAELRRALLAYLEQAYSDLAREFGDAPRQTVVVILYTDQAFFDVTQAPSWMGAINDGKLRIPLRGVDLVTGALARVLRHELAHSFINYLSRGRAPIWLHEGIAQRLEGKSISGFGRVLARGFAGGHYIPLNGMEGPFTTFSTGEAQVAYAESLAFVEYIVETYGFSDVVRILQRIAEGSSTEVALRSTVHTGYAGLETDLTAWLKSKYGD